MPTAMPSAQVYSNFSREKFPAVPFLLVRAKNLGPTVGTGCAQFFSFFN
jgi:hypothetical protein